MIAVCFLAIIIHVSVSLKKQDITFEISKALQKIVDYMLKTNDKIGLQGYFGVIRAKALLEEINFQGLDENVCLLLGIQEKIDIILNRHTISENKREWILRVMEYDLWRKKIIYEYIDYTCPIIGKNKTLELFSQLSNEVETACITPDMFDFCMSNMYDIKRVNGDLYTIENSCKYFMFSTYHGIGYETTHRLLYIQTFREWIYKRKTMFYKNFVKDICLNIYDQALATVGRGPFFDLFLEQIFLCGVEGYMEFLNMNWLTIVLNNQLPEGCFSLFEKKYRNNLTTIERCSEHATGLAVATLSLHLHFLSNLRFIK